MCKILIFGGTTEGRILAEFCHKRKLSAWISVVTGYGKMVLPESNYLSIQESAMNAREMEQFMDQNGIRLVLDATHPYASEVSQNIKTACNKTSIPYHRVLRESFKQMENGGSVVRTDSVEEAVSYLNNKTGNILVTTGSKELSHFTNLDAWEERVFARVLPSVSVFTSCEKMGLKGKHLIGMQGPFSEEMNQALIRQFGIQYLVTKEAGNAGGFPEKMRAAASCNITAVVIGRPAEEEGITVEEAVKILAPDNLPVKRKMYLIGTGMGGQDELTVKAFNAMQTCDAVFGAKRMLQSVSSSIPDAVKIPFYLSREILPWLEQHREYRQIGILYSGDTGFYSGAKNLLKALKEVPYKDQYETEVFPGISSVSYLCSRLKSSWEDIHLISLHGRQWDIIKELKEHQRVFTLLDGTNTVNKLCRILIDEGFAKVKLSVGERLSYSDERITVGVPGTMIQQEFDSLAAVVIER